jgi:hypothetical protein
VALRTAGLLLAPVATDGQPVTLRVVALAPNQQCWPTGWKPAGSPRTLVPAMYRFTTVEIEDYPLEQALEALAPHAGIPLVVDAHMVARRRIDMAAKVKYPAEKTYIRRALDRILAQGRLAGELRVDEAGRPFYWITQWGPESPRAVPSHPNARPAD